MSHDKPSFEYLKALDAIHRWILKKLPSSFVEMSWNEKTQTGFVISKGVWLAVRGVIFDENGNIIVRKVSEHLTLEGAQKAANNWWIDGEQKMHQFNHGDVIACGRVFYSHHAIFDKEQDAVIEYYGSSSGKEKATIRLTPIKEFVLREASFGLRMSSYSYPTGVTIFKPHEVIALARSKVGSADYDLLGQNCQHLASFCTTGKAQSWEINMFQQAFGIVSGTILTGMAMFVAVCAAIKLLAPTLIVAQAIIAFLLTPTGWITIGVLCGIGIIGASGVAFVAACKYLKKKYKHSKIMTLANELQDLIL